MNANPTVDAYTAWQAGRSFSVKTIRRRQTSLTSFLRHITPMLLADAELANVEEWLALFTSPRTRHAYRSDLNCFYVWAVRRKVCPVNPVADTDSIRVPKALPRPLNPEMVLLAVACADTLQLRLMVCLAAYAGLRCAEISSLETDDVSLRNDCLMLTVRNGKGGKDRLVPLHPDLVLMLAAHKGQGRYVPLLPDTVGRRVSQHLRACGIDATCHQLRHSFGTQVARLARGNMVLVGRVMGHSCMTTTAGYVGWDGGDALAVIARLYEVT